jgi:hypothetical protein
MRYFDPTRPIGLSGRPCYTRRDGTPVAALPGLSLRPRPRTEGEPQWWEVSVHLLVGVVTAREFSMTISTEHLPGFLLAWLESPEAVLRDHFGYRPPEPLAQVRGKPVVSLEELLDE